jgi:hypothetical protein
MAKISYDKYYTPPTVARYCIEKVKEIIGEKNITEWFEPSAGSGTFSNQITDCEAYDLYPQNDNVKQANFLELGLQYKKGRLFIGNPPFGGSTGKLLRDFYGKCVQSGDYIAFILPAGYYNNYSSFKEFEIIHSNLFETEFTNAKLKTAFVIYKKNPTKNRFENVDYSIPFITHTLYSRKNKGEIKKIDRDYDYSFVSFGNILKPAKPYQYAGVRTMKIESDKYRDEIIKVMKWAYKYNQTTKFFQRTNISIPSLMINKLNRLIRICIPEIDLEYPIKINDK